MHRARAVPPPRAMCKKSPALKNADFFTPRQSISTWKCSDEAQCAGCPRPLRLNDDVEMCDISTSIRSGHIPSGFPSLWADDWDEQRPKSPCFQGFSAFIKFCWLKMAEGVGFEPTYRLLTDNSISSRARYGHFATPPQESGQARHGGRGRETLLAYFARKGNARAACAEGQSHECLHHRTGICAHTRVFLPQTRHGSPGALQPSRSAAMTARASGWAGSSWRARRARSSAAWFLPQSTYMRAILP